MFCPKCSQEQISSDVKFCSRCGLLLSAISKIVDNDGLTTHDGAVNSPRVRGTKQGGFFLLAALLLFPILLILAKEMSVRPAMFILFVMTVAAAGILRIVYALMFESGAEPQRSTRFAAPEYSAPSQLAAPNTNPLEMFNGRQSRDWRGSGELEPVAVTDRPTQIL